MPMGKIQVISKQNEFSSLYELTLLLRCKEKRLKKEASIDVKKLFDEGGLMSEENVGEFVNNTLKDCSFKNQ
jgi:hypothetical protein